MSELIRPSQNSVSSCRGWTQEPSLFTPRRFLTEELPLDAFVADDPARRVVLKPYLREMNAAYRQGMPDGLPQDESVLRSAIGEAVFQRAPREEQTFLSRAISFAKDLIISPARADCGVVTIPLIIALASLLMAGCLVTPPKGPWDDDDDGFKGEVDCNDKDPDVHPGAIDTPCDGIDQDCDGHDTVADRDGDNFTCDIDVDDNNALVRGGATETPCNGIDEDGDYIDATADFNNNGVECWEGVCSVESGDLDSCVPKDCADLLIDFCIGVDSDDDGVVNDFDNCPEVENADQKDLDGDNTGDLCDVCPNDPQDDADQDGVCADLDGCPDDRNKTAPGVCGCGVPDTDSDLDGTPNCNDQCVNDAAKVAPGQCGCGELDTDSDFDGTADCNDLCLVDPEKVAPGTCGCGEADTDSDSDGTPDCIDLCPMDTEKVAPGSCGCGIADVDEDHDGTPNCNDFCPTDPNKIAPGFCGCGVSDIDSDRDGAPDCSDQCASDPQKTAPGVCGCGVPDTDSDLDGTPNCNDRCVNDAAKVAPGQCGCGVADTDTDLDGVPDCQDQCADDPQKIAPGQCGCGELDTDSDLDGTADCNDLCPADSDKITPGLCGCGISDIDSDSDGTPDCGDQCASDPQKTAPGQCGCGVADTDSDSDGTPDCNDLCANDPAKVAPGQCGCGVADTDSDGDGVANCKDNCPTIPNPDQTDKNPGGPGDACDADGDNFAAVAFGGTDCNDADPFINPGALEIACDAIDNDCNSSTADIIDGDDDGFECVTEDCDDSDPAVKPGAQEVRGDGIDNNCDGYEDAWTKTFDISGGGNDGVLNIIPDGAGGAYWAGYTKVTGQDYNIIYGAMSAVGEIVGPIQMINGSANGKDLGAGLVLSPGGATLFLTGALTSSSQDIWEAKVAVPAPLNQPIASRVFDGQAHGTDIGNDILLLEDGSRIIIGEMGTSTGGQDIAIMRADDTSSIWTLTYDGTAHSTDTGFGLARQPGSDVFYAAGGIRETGQADKNLWAGAINVNGTPLWTRFYSGVFTRGVTGRHIAIGPGGTLHLVGEERRTANSTDVWIYTVNPANGDLLSAQDIISTTYDEWSTSIVVDQAGRRILVGAVGTAAQGTDARLTIIDPAGQAILSETYDGVFHGNDSYNSITMDAGGNIFIGGFTLVGTGAGDVMIRKLARLP